MIKNLTALVEHITPDKVPTTAPATVPIPTPTFFPTSVPTPPKGNLKKKRVIYHKIIKKPSLVRVVRRPLYVSPGLKVAQRINFCL